MKEVNGLKNAEKYLSVPASAVDGQSRQQQPYLERDSDEIDLAQMFSILRRRWKLFVIAGTVGATIGLAYVATTTRLYTASVSLSLDTVDAANVREKSGVESIPLSESQIETELEVIRSEAIAEKIVEQLALDNNSQFLAVPQTGLSRLRRLASEFADYARDAIFQVPVGSPVLTPSPEDLAVEQRERAVSILRANMAVNRVRTSGIVVIKYTSMSPQLAARIANEVADTYIRDQLDSKYAATERAAAWLKERSDQLRLEAATLDNEIEEFRVKNGLVGLNNKSGSNIEIQQLAEQLTAAQTELVTLRARQRRLEQIIDLGDTSAAVSATATQSITSSLRSRFLDTLKQYNSLQGRLGQEHEQLQRLRTELDQIQQLMFEEIKRAEELMRNDIQLAMERVDNLQKAKRLAESEMEEDSEVFIELRDMERKAETVRGLYTNFLQRYQQSLQEQSFEVSDVRVINPARIPSTPVSPNSSRITLLSAMLALIAAGGWIAFVEIRDQRVRTEEQIRERLGFEYLGFISQIKVGRFQFMGTGHKERSGGEVQLSKKLSYSIDHPLSTAAETLRAVKMAISLRTQGTEVEERGKVVGFVSCFPGEGKTTTSANFAALVASQGYKTILIDADLRNPSLSHSIHKSVEVGIVEVLVDEADWSSAVLTDPTSGLDVLLRKPGRVSHTSELVSGKAMRNLLDVLRTEYDYIILDLPPVAPVIDSRAALDLIDGIVFVFKWGVTDIRRAEAVIHRDPRLREKALGAIMNFYDAKKAKSYGSYSNYYYSADYKRYYSEN